MLPLMSTFAIVRAPALAVARAAALVAVAAALALTPPVQASPFDRDTDADGRPDHSDNCPALANADQADADGDADGDLCDCAPTAAGVSRLPSSIGSSLHLAGSTLAWTRAPQGPVSNVYRGTISGPFAFDDQCFRAGVTETHATDSDLPAAGTTLYYLVAGRNLCGEGDLTHAASACPSPGGSQDADGDGVADLSDNCVLVANAALTDQDHDFAGDACDTCALDPTDDADGDGVCARTRGPAFDWRDSIVYVLIPHKFENGDLANDFMKTEYSLPNPAYEGGFLGGDLQGAIDRMSYLKGLGVNTVLMYPPFENDRNQFFGFLPTGYRPVDWRNIDRNFGSPSLMAQFVDELHRAPGALRLIVDLPIGMAGIEHPWNTRQLDFPFWFRPWGTENVASEPAQTAYGPVDNAFGMAIINHLLGVAEHDRVYRTLVDDVMIWLSREYGIDGLRYDSAQNFWVDFWSEGVNRFRREVNRVRPDTTHFGEWAWLGPTLSWQRADHEYVNAASPTGIRFTGIYDFSMISDIRQVFGRSVNPNLLVFNHDARRAAFEDPSVLGASIDNYEADSFLEAVVDGNAKPRIKLALAFLVSIDRVPLIYSGNEYAIDYTTPGTLFGPGLDAAFHQWFKNVLAIRATQPVLRRGAVTWLTRNATYLSLARTGPAGRIISAFSISSRTNRQETLSIGASGINCASVSNLLDPADTGNQLSGSGSSQTLRITHDPWEPKILLCQ